MNVPFTADIAAHPRGSEGQQRPQAFAAGRHDMGGQLGDQGDRAVHAGYDGAAAGIHVRLQQGEERRECVLLRALRPRQ